MGMENTKTAPIRLRIKEIEIIGWIGQATPSDVLEYHRGALALDINVHGTRLADRDRAELARVASRAWWASEQRLIHLVQRRHGADDYSYLAIARPRPDCAPLSLFTLIPEEEAA